MRKTKEVSLEEIAKLANVSTATVSRVINNKENVNQKTRDRVMQVISDKNYTFTDRQKGNQLKENGNQLMEKAKESNTIVVLLPDFSNPFNDMVTDGIRKAAKVNDFGIVFVLVKGIGTPLSYYEEILKDINIAGIISLSPFPNLNIALELKKRWPLVMCSEYLDNQQISFVGIDDIKAAKQATSFLLKSGRKNIALINSSLDHKYARDREAGYKIALAENNIDFRDELVIRLSTINYQMALSQLIFLFSSKNDIDAVFACSDIFAAAAVGAAKEVGKKVPDDISIVGFDNIDLSLMVSPSLTTVSQPSFEIGYQSCEILIESIHKPQLEPKNVTLFTDFIIREST